MRIIAAIALSAASLVVGFQAARGHRPLPALPLWPLAAFLGVGVLQLMPLPAGLHALVAPGSYEVWHPTEPAAAALLGEVHRPLSVDPEATLRWLALAVGLAALVLLAAPALADRRLALRAAVTVTVGGLAVSAYAIVARAVFGPLLYGRIPVPTVSPFGPFVSKNHFAGYAEMATLLALGLGLGLADKRTDTAILGWVRRPHAGRVLLATGAALAMALGVLVSLSRGGVLSLAGGCVALAGLRWTLRRRPLGRRRGALLFGVLGPLAVAATLVVLLPTEAHRRMLGLVGGTSEQSASFRLDTWRDSFRAAGTSLLLGHGMAAFADALPRFKKAHGELRVEHAENDYLELLAEGGVLGLGCALWAMASFTRIVLRGLRKAQDRLLRGLGAGALAGMVALLVHSGFDFNLRIPSNALLFGFLASLALGAAGAGVAPRRPVASWALELGLIACLAGLMNAPAASSAPRLQVPDPVGPPEARALRLTRATMVLRARLDRRPADAGAWLYLGWVKAVGGARKEGAALARYAARLDPQRIALREEAERLSGPREAPE